MNGNDREPDIRRRVDTLELSAKNHKQRMLDAWIMLAQYVGLAPHPAAPLREDEDERC